MQLQVVFQDLTHYVNYNLWVVLWNEELPQCRTKFDKALSSPRGHSPCRAVSLAPKARISRKKHSRQTPRAFSCTLRAVSHSTALQPLLSFDATFSNHITVLESDLGRERHKLVHSKGLFEITAQVLLSFDSTLCFVLWNSYTKKTPAPFNAWCWTPCFILTPWSLIIFSSLNSLKPISGISDRLLDQKEHLLHSEVFMGSFCSIWGNWFHWNS